MASDHDSTFQVTETPTLTTWPSVTFFTAHLSMSFTFVYAAIQGVAEISY